MPDENDKPEGYEERLAAVRAEKLASMGVDPLPKGKPRPPNSMLGIQPNGAPPVKRKSKGRSPSTSAPIIDHILAASGPMTIDDVLRAFNENSPETLTRDAIQNALYANAEKQGWTHERRGHTAFWSKASPGIPADEIAEKPTVLPVEKDATPFEAAKANRDNLHASANLESMTDLLAAVRTLRRELRTVGITFEDRFFLAALREETARQDAQAGSDVPKDT